MEEVPGKSGNGPRETLNAGAALGNRFSRLPASILAAVLCVVACTGDESGFAPRPPETSSEAEVGPVDGAPQAGVPYLRVSAGTVVRSAPSTDAPVIDTVHEDGLLPIRESRGELHRVAEPGGPTGWIRSGSTARVLRMRSSRLPPQDSVEAEAEVLERAAAAMDGARRIACGSYTLLTDVSGQALESLCRRVGAELDAAFRIRYGVVPRGRAQETLIVFKKRDALTRFSAVDGPRLGYAGHARAGDGYLAMFWPEPAVDENARTLVHEMSHLVARRALGAPLPRWLSEGLADGLGDPATLRLGLGRIEGLHGAEAQARRVLERPDLPDLSALTGLDATAFDGGAAARDYEQSAVFVRFLMSDPGRRKGFRAYLQGIAAGGSDSREQLAEQLGIESWSELDRALRQWLREALR